MRTRTVNIINFVTIFLLLAGCSIIILGLLTQTSSLVAETPTKTSNLNSTLISEGGNTSNNSMIESPTKTPEQVLAPAATDSIMFDPNKITCPKITKNLPDAGALSGKIVLFDYDKKSLIFYDLKNGSRKPIVPENDNANSYAVSSNGKWLAYEYQDASSEAKRLIVMTAQGEQVINLPWLKEWWKIAYWLDDQQLVIQLKPFGNTDVLILNPFTNNQKKISFHSQKLYALEYPPNWRGAGPIIYDPSQQRAAFAGFNDVYFLANAENGEILASIQSISFLQFPTRAPQWSPDGTQVLIAASNSSPMDFKNDELFSISQNGITTKLTEFNKLSVALGITRYSWSPNGRYIAFFLVLSPSKRVGEQLALLNISTKHLVVYCIQGDTTGNYRKNLNGFYNDQIYSGVVWSPDGQKVILENRIGESVSNIILIDIENDIAVQIISGENVQPIGWMTNP